MQAALPGKKHFKTGLSKEVGGRGRNHAEGLVYQIRALKQENRTEIERLHAEN